MLSIFNTSERSRGILFALLTALIWGVLALKLKLALQYIDSYSLIWARFFFALLMLLAWMKWKKKSLNLRIRPFNYMIPCALGLGLNYLGFIQGIEFSGPVTAQIIIQFGPMLLAISGVVIFKEQIRKKQLIGLFFLIPGFILFYSQKIAASPSFDIYNKGSLLILFGALSWSVYAIFQKLLVRNHNPENINLFIFLFCSFLFLPIVDFKTMTGLSTWPTFLVILLGLNTLLAYSFVGEALKRVEANMVGVIITVNPLITVLFVLVLEGLGFKSFGPENLNLLTVLGILTYIIGAVIFIYYGMPGKGLSKTKNLPSSEQAHKKALN